MSLKRRVLGGVVSGAGGAIALTGLRKLLSWFGLVGDTAPEQVVERLRELGILDGSSPGDRRALTVGAHLLYGVGMGAAFGLLRRERGGPAEEAAAGSALGVLSWGAGWASWLPLAGVHSPPWKQRTPKVLLPVLDHAFFGAVWGITYRLLRRD